MIFLGWPLLLAEPARAQTNYATPYTFVTMAGTGHGASDGVGSGARFYAPEGACADALGNLYVADCYNHTIRKVTPAGVVTTLAGYATVSGSSDGNGSVAHFYEPCSVAMDRAGNIYVADSDNDTIRQVTPTGSVVTVAGQAGLAGSSDGTSLSARFNNPCGVAVDGAGNIYVADYNNDTVRKITPAGVVSTVAGLAGSAGSSDGVGSAARFASPCGIAVDAGGNLYVADQANDTIRKITAFGVVSTVAGLAGDAGSSDGAGVAARFNGPAGVGLDSGGNLYVADTLNDEIREVTPAGVVTTVAGSAGTAGAADGTGAGARFNEPFGVNVDAAGNVYVADDNNNEIRKIAAGGIVTTVAGTAGGQGNVDGSGSGVRFGLPGGVAVDASGNVYVADALEHTIRKITAAGVATTLAGLPSVVGAADGTGNSARFNEPVGVAVDLAGNVYVADTFNDEIRKITPSGAVTTLAGAPGVGGSLDGVGAAARFDHPYGIAVDAADNVYVADTYNCTIRKLTPAGLVTTLAGSAGRAGDVDATGATATFNYPTGIAVDGSGNLYVADYGNDSIREIAAGSTVTTLAGETGLGGYSGSAGSDDSVGSSARFNRPWSVAVDAAGNVYTTDSSNQTIRKIGAGRAVTTLAGTTGILGGSDGTGAAARFFNPEGIAVDRTGTLYVGDSGNFTVRRGQLGGFGPPVATQPAAQVISGGSSVVFSVAAAGGAAVSCYWQLNGLNLAGATTSRLVVAGASASNAGTYTCVLVDSAGATTTVPVTLTVATTGNPGRLGNLSVLSDFAAGQTLTVGFVTGGLGTSGLQSMLIRATGPSLAAATGLTGTIADPQLQVIPLGQSTIIAANDNWSSTPGNQALVTAADLATFAFPLLPGSADAALVDALAQGAYSVQVSGSGPGKALTEVYDATAPGSYGPTSPRLVNLSCNDQIAADGSLTAGFTIGGATGRTVLIRASGPTLQANFGVAGAMTDPQLVLYNGSQAVLATNAGWIGDPQIAAAAASVSAFPFVSSSSLDSAVLITLAPGTYTAVVSSASGGGGIVLEEIYEIP